MVDRSLPEPDAAWALLQQERFGDAVDLSARILALYPNNVSAIACHAMAIWRGRGDDAQAIGELKRAVELAPNESSLRHNLGVLLTSSGEVEAAAQQYREALRLKPDDTLAFWGLGLNHRFGQEDELIRSMVALHADVSLEKLRREFLAFGLAKAFDDLSVPERAMDYALEANRLGARPWDAAGAERALAEITAVVGDDAFRRARSSGHPTRAPLFIVGMNRSGTTLVESILARHPEVLALGESPQIVSAERDARLRRDAAGRPAELGRDWLAARAEGLVRGWAVQAQRPFRIVTDKLPENALRLGLVRQLFPRARVIHMRRHPLDVGVSNFFQRFGEGQGFSTRLDWIGLYTRQVADSMAVWRRGLDLEVLEVSYEALVADPEPEIRRIARFAGPDWSDALLTPEQSTRAVKTASQWQVRQPINSGSVGRWKRYEPWLGPMIEAMGGFAWVDRYVAESSEGAESRGGGFT
ncbi:MAG: sulfotransferase [Devosia sp.]|nr:sulfotransferase [Devosia sp.]